MSSIKIDGAGCPFCVSRTTFKGDPALAFCDEHDRDYLATFQIYPKDLDAHRATVIERQGDAS